MQLRHMAQRYSYETIVLGGEQRIVKTQFNIIYRRLHIERRSPLVSHKQLRATVMFRSWAYPGNGVGRTITTFDIVQSDISGTFPQHFFSPEVEVIPQQNHPENMA